MAPSSVLVLGAGELGLAMLHSLTAHPLRSNTRIAVLLRSSTANSQNEDKRKHVAAIKAQGIDVVEGDVAEFTSQQLAATFSSFDTIINCCGIGMAPGTQLKVAEAAIASGCRKYFPWQFGVDYEAIGRDSAQDLFTEQLDVRDLLRSQTKVKWLIVSTGIFTSFIFEPHFGVISQDMKTVTALGSWENEITVTTPEDIGRLTAEMALAYTDLEGVVFTAGDTLSMSAIADTVESLFGTKVQRSLETVAQSEEDLKADPNNTWKKYRVVFTKGVGISWAKDETFNGRNKIPTQTVEAWAKQHLAL